MTELTFKLYLIIGIHILLESGGQQQGDRSTGKTTQLYGNMSVEEGCISFFIEKVGVLATPQRRVI